MRCPHCGGDAFTHRRAQLNTALATLFSLDAFNKSADVYVCRRCGRIEWFVEPDPVYLAEIAPPAQGLPAVECPKCNMIVGANQSRCAGCGWTRG
jgi:ribosomal protein L37E